MGIFSFCGNCMVNREEWSEFLGLICPFLKACIQSMPLPNGANGSSSANFSNRSSKARVSFMWHLPHWGDSLVPCTENAVFPS
jgi:hypothetical protein